MTENIFEKSFNNFTSKPIFEDYESYSGSFKRVSDLNLPDLPEIEVMRHYKELSDKNFCIEKDF